jgi:hypothetical protein
MPGKMGYKSSAIRIMRWCEKTGKLLLIPEKNCIISSDRDASECIQSTFGGWFPLETGKP